MMAKDTNENFKFVIFPGTNIVYCECGCFIMLLNGKFYMYRVILGFD